MPLPWNHPLCFGIFACTLAGCSLGPTTSEASEVVKLARLIVTGKRSNPSPEPQRPAAESRSVAEWTGLEPATPA